MGYEREHSTSIGLFFCSDKESSNLADNLLQVKAYTEKTEQEKLLLLPIEEDNDLMEVEYSPEVENKRLKLKVEEQANLIEKQRYEIVNLKELKNLKTLRNQIHIDDPEVEAPNSMKEHHIDDPEVGKKKDEKSETLNQNEQPDAEKKND